MKYFTKELYRNPTHLHVSLKPSDRAAEFSEEYFQELYERHVQKRLDMMKRVSEADPKELAERILLSATPSVRVVGTPITKQVRQKVKDIQSSLVQALRKAPPIQFDPQIERQFAHNQYLFDLRTYQCNLPAEILNNVADVRVLALEHAVPEVIDAIRNYCEANKKKIATAAEAYKQEFKRNFAGGIPGFLEKFQWHDAKVVAVRYEGGDIWLDFNWEESCRFIGAEFVECDEPLANAYWMDNEIYPLENGGYEIHVLLYQPPAGIWVEGKHIGFIIRCRDVEIHGRH